MTIRDLPDNYPWMPGSTRYPMPDMGELAARLGSPVVYDRRGEAVFVDNFSHGLAPYTASALGTGASVKVTATNTDIGSFAAELIAGSDGVRQALLRRHFSPSSLQSIGLEVSMYITVGGLEHALLDVARYDGTNLHWGRVRFGQGSGLQYFDSSGSWVDFGTVTAWATTDVVYHNLKLVVDLDNDEYVRFLYDETEYDLSGLDIRVIASAVQPQHIVQFVLQSASGQNNKVQLGRFIVTGNEP